MESQGSEILVNDSESSQADTLGEKLGRECQLLKNTFLGVNAAAHKAFVEHPVRTSIKFGAAVTVGVAMARLLPTRGLLGTAAKLLTAEMGASFALDVGANLKRIGLAIKDTAESPAHYKRSVACMQDCLGSTLVDGAVMMTGGVIGHKAAYLGSRGVLALKEGEGWGFSERLLGKNRINLAKEPQIATLYDGAADSVFRIKRINFCKKNAITSSEGTGFFIDDRGTAITAAHVVGGLGERQVLTLSSGKRLNAYVVALDAQKDLALLKVAGPAVPKDYLKIGSEPEAGAKVLGLGYPLQSNGNPVVSPGTFVEPYLRTRSWAPAFPQSELKFSIHTRPGQSGGPILNEKGEVIGVVSMGEILPSGKKFTYAPSQDALGKFLSDWDLTVTRPAEEAIKLARSIGGY
jgi:V8-like Glu-specific endopeptidase